MQLVSPHRSLGNPCPLGRSGPAPEGAYRLNLVSASGVMTRAPPSPWNGISVPTSAPRFVAAEGIVFIVPEPAHCRSGLGSPCFDSPALTWVKAFRLDHRFNGNLLTDSVCQRGFYH
jgi:hypothetical protein